MGTMEKMIAGPDGWSDWIHPLPGYKMGCCDCSLVHEMEFAIVPAISEGSMNRGENSGGVIIFRAKRAIDIKG